jgi:hypothetical protein
MVLLSTLGITFERTHGFLHCSKWKFESAGILLKREARISSSSSSSSSSSYDSTAQYGPWPPLLGVS